MDLRAYFDIARRWWWLVLICSLIAGLTASLASRQQTRIYQATSLVLLDTSKAASDMPAYNDLVTSERLSRTYATLFSSSETINEAVARLGRQPATLTISADPQRDTSLLLIRVESDDAEAAAYLANQLPIVLGEQQLMRQNLRYIESRQNLAAELERLGTRITDIRAEIDRLTARGAAEGSAALSQLNSDLALQQSTYETLLKNVAALQLAEVNSREVLSVVEAATVPKMPIRPRPLTTLLTALLLGALIGGGVVYLIEYLDDTIKSDSIIAAEGGGDGVLARVGRLSKSGKRVTINDLDARDPAIEAYRILRTNIRFASVDKPLTSLMVTSPSPGDGKSTTAANLALVMSHAGVDTILVDADLRRPVQHQLFNLLNREGLTSALLDRSKSIAGYLRAVKDNEHLRLLPTGPLPPNPSELLGSKRMQEVLKELESLAELVIIDTPPILVVSDSSILAREVTGVTLVMRANKTTFKAVEAAMAQLESTGASILGTIINDVPAGQHGYYYYSHYYSPHDDAGNGGDGPPDPKRRPATQPLPTRLLGRLQGRQ